MFILKLIVMLLLANSAHAQCVGEIINVKQDDQRGSIVVFTEYKLNGEKIQEGETRYDDSSGTNTEIINLVKSDIKTHCQNIIRRITINQKFIQDEMLKIQKEITTPIIIDIEQDLIRYKETILEVEDIYKNKKVKTTYDSKNTVLPVVINE